MKRFNRGRRDRFGGNDSRGYGKSDEREHNKRSYGEYTERSDSRRFGMRNSGGPRFHKQSYTVTCDKCGRSCEVPFKPTGDKPVYCRDCFRNQGGKGEPRGDTGNNQQQNKAEFAELNEKLDKIMDALAIPR